MSASTSVGPAAPNVASSGGGASADEAPRHTIAFRRRRFANWFPLGLTYACFYMGRYNFNVAKGAIGSAYHYDKAQMGLIATAGFWTYALSVLLNGPLADRFGGRRAILFGAVGACALNLALGTLFFGGAATSVLVSMSLLYSVNMYFQSFGALSVVKVNSAWFHVRERGVLGGFFGAMISMGYMLALGTGGWILANLPLWCVFVVPAGVILVMFAVDFFLVRDRPSDAGHADFETGDEQIGDPTEVLSFGERLRRVTAHPVIRILLVAEFCTGLVRQGLLLYFTEFLKEVHGVAPGSTWFQVASTGITVGGIIGGLACGFASDYLFQSRRGPVAFIFYCGQVVALVLLGLAGSPQLAALMIGVSCMWIFGVHGMLSGTASMDFGGRKAAATAAGLLDGVQYLGSGLVGFGLGALLDRYHWKIWPYAMIPFSIIGALLMLPLWNARPSRASAH
jgi:OPA family glycerol-3-phosphate transporter-like MFS transporter